MAREWDDDGDVWQVIPSVLGSYLAGSRDHDMGGSRGKLGEPLCGVVAVISAVAAPSGRWVVSGRRPASFPGLTLAIYN
jgi:hypothetical protein